MILCKGNINMIIMNAYEKYYLFNNQLFIDLSNVRIFKESNEINESIYFLTSNFFVYIVFFM